MSEVNDGGVKEIEMDKAGFKCITCGEITYTLGCDAKAPELEVRETTQCLECMRAHEPVSRSLLQRIPAKYF
ncbi:hypothetical protein ES708_24538 [subsurface metagenome]